MAISWGFSSFMFISIYMRVHLHYKKCTRFQCTLRCWLLGFILWTLLPPLLFSLFKTSQWISALHFYVVIIFTACMKFTFNYDFDWHVCATCYVRSIFLHRRKSNRNAQYANHIKYSLFCTRLSQEIGKLPQQSINIKIARFRQTFIAQYSVSNLCLPSMLSSFILNAKNVQLLNHRNGIF